MAVPSFFEALTCAKSAQSSYPARMSAGTPRVSQAALRRGRRQDTSDGASGLGLAIANDIAEAWDATVAVANLDPDLRATLQLRE